MSQDKLFSVTTSPVKADGTFSATFKGLLNYTGGGTISGVWEFGDGQVMKYRNDTPFTHNGYRGYRKYNVKLKITKNYRRNIGQSTENTEKYFQVKTIEIGASGQQSKATLVQSKR